MTREWVRSAASAGRVRAGQVTRRWTFPATELVGWGDERDRAKILPLPHICRIWQGQEVEFRPNFRFFACLCPI
jgi:hypothetical protein